MNGMKDRTALVLRALGLGDMLVAVPALRGLRRHLSGHRIVLATSAAIAPIAARSGAVDAVLPIARPQDLFVDGRPDVAVNMHGAGPESHRALDATAPAHRIGTAAPGWPGPPWHMLTGHERERWCAMLAWYGIPADPLDLRLPHSVARHAGIGGDVSEVLREAVAGHGVPDQQGILGAYGVDPPVIVHPGAKFGAKRWPPRRFAGVAAALRARGLPVLVTGSAVERPLASWVARAARLPGTAVLAGRVQLPHLADLVSAARLVICGDTGIAHLATAFATPSVVLFGPAAPRRWGPPPDGPHWVLTDARVRRGDPFANDPDPALLAVDVPDVLAAAADLLTGPS